MQYITMGNLSIDYKNPAQVEEMPWEHKLVMADYLRETFKEDRKEAALNGGIEATWPGVGVVTFTGRHFRFEFEPEYAAAKGYAPVREGNWG